MATPEQIEAVKQAIGSCHYGAIPFDVGEFATMADAAIVAYEAARPAVPGDEELADLYRDTHNDVSRRHGIDPRLHPAGNLAGIRAVRERLAGAAVPEVTDAMVMASMDAYTMAAGDRPYAIHDDLMRHALAAALAEAGKEGES